ncbi:ATP-binding cassette domain-containing protein [Nonomuraea sp. NPDC050478]|uniref:ATP-binding cassette domain-containing protein n=1 Tax=Nonomuraea sp. NPDC050478 TaxID=3364365 RepID=UPI00378E736B
MNGDTAASPATLQDDARSGGRPDSTSVLVATDLRKNFGAVAALAGASLHLRRGEVMALMGDNGAGKSTLVKSIAGVVVPDSGEILINGEPRRFAGPGDALRAGIETVYQDLALVDSMSASENVFLGREPVKAGPLGRLFKLVDRRRMADDAGQALAGIGAKIPSLADSVSAMSGGQRQALAVARAMLWGKNIVMLDEPTAALGVQESEGVLEIITALKTQDVSVLMISHNLEHVFKVADRVTVMRQGRTVGERHIRDVVANDIVGLITGGSEVS